MRLGSVLSSRVIRSRVHNLMAVPSLSAISRCTRVFRPSQCPQRSDFASLMACRCLLVGAILCITMCQMDVVSSDTQAVCRLFHPCVQFVSGLRCDNLISLDSFAVATIVCRVLFTSRLNIRSVSYLPGVLCTPCQAHIDISTLMFSGILPL